MTLYRNLQKLLFFFTDPIAISIWLSIFSFEVHASPAALSYQGKIATANGTPLSYSSVSFIFQIYDPSGQCLIYREQVNGIDMSVNPGYFDVPIGKGTVYYPASGSFTILDAFNNSTSYTCSGGSTYSPVSGDQRVLRVQFHDGNGWQTITPDTTIRSVPFAGYAQTAERLGSNVASDFVLKNSVNSGTSCAAGEFLTWNGVSKTFSCATPAGSGSGGVSQVTATSPLSVTNGTTTPAISIQAASGAQGGYLTSTDWSTFNNKLGTSSTFSGDVSGTSSTTSVDKIKGTAVSVSSLTSGQFLKYNGSNWINAAMATSDISGIGNYIPYSSLPNCNSASSTLTFVSATDTFSCTAISIAGTQVSGNISGSSAGFTGALSGDVSGSQGSTSVDKIKGVAVSATAPTNNQVLQYNGTSWTPATISVSASGAAGGDLTGTYPNPTLSNVVTAGTGTKITYDAKGRVTSSTTLSASDIPSIDWSKISSGTPTTLSGYGITNGVTNAGNSVSLQADVIANRPSAGTLGRYFVATDTKELSYDNGSAWISIASSSGSGGTVTSLTGDVTSSGSGAVSTTVNTVGTSTAANIHAAEVLANAATSANTSSTIVKRDSSGNFTAGTITANLTGNVTGNITGNVTGSASLNVLKAGDSMTGNLNFASGKGSVYTDTGSNTATLQGPNGAITSSYILRLPTAQGSATQVLTNDGSGNLYWNTPSTTATSYSGVLPIANGGTALSTTPTNGQLLIGNGTGYTLATLTAGSGISVNNSAGGITIATSGLLANSLADGTIWVGQSGTPTAVTPSGDASMTNAGSFTVNKIKGKTVSANPTSPGQVLRYDGTNWTPNFVSMADLRSTVTGTSALSSSCASNETLVWSSASDSLTCANISLPVTQITGTFSVANGGTGLSSYTVGDLIYASGATTLSKLSAGTSNYVLTSNGAGNAPSWQTLPITSSTGTANYIPYYSSSGVLANSNIYYDGSAVGIGTTTPTFKLSISGTASPADRKIGINGTQVVYLPDQTNFTGSMFVGDGGGSIAHTSGNEGFYNTGFGVGSLLSNTTGYNNTAVGGVSLKFNTTGRYNTAVGAIAMLSNTTGNNNTAVGNSSLASNTTGSNNVANGYGALNSNTTGSDNTAVGNTALNYNTTGTQNTALGSYALQASTTGVQNTATGYYALQNNSTGNYNTAIGTYSLQGSSTAANNIGIQNTALGHSSLKGMSSGSGNIGVGYNAGSAITTGSYNVIVGSNTGAAVATSSNNILIADGAGNERLRIDSSGNVGIKVTSPQATLDVAGAIKSKDVSNTTTTIDFSSGNFQYTSANCGSLTLQNLKPGSSYFLAVQGAGGGTCTIANAYSDSGSTSLTVKTGTASLTQTASKHLLISFMVLGSYVYVTSADGY